MNEPIVENAAELRTLAVYAAAEAILDVEKASERLPEHMRESLIRLISSAADYIIGAMTATPLQDSVSLEIDRAAKAVQESREANGPG